jgi:SAM-dependent methyltransferase
MSGDEVARKYDALADGYSSRYADPDAVARFFVGLVRTWGGRVEPPATILELGCADGFMTHALAKAGYTVTAVDIAPRMIEVARERLAGERLDAAFHVADVRSFEPEGRFDVVLGAMWTFFAYVEDPLPVLRRLLAASESKLIVDINPRTHPVSFGRRSLLEAGSRRIATTPVALSHRYRLRPGARAAMGIALHTPGLSSILLRRKFTVALLGSLRDTAIQPPA